MTKVAITGVSGFIGKEVARYLLDCGLDVLSVGRSTPDFDIQHIQCDFLNEDKIDPELFKGVDAVVHLAAIPATVDGIDVEDVNTSLTEKVYNAARAASVASFVLISSVKAVAETTICSGPLDSSVRPEPQDAYGRSKLASEQVCNSVGESCAMVVTIIRPPLVYGPGVKGNFLNLVKLASLPVPLPLSGLIAKRSMLYVGNLADLIYSVISKGGVPGTFYACDGYDVSTSELICVMRRVLSNNARLFYCPIFVFRLAFIVLRRKDYFDKLFSELKVSNSELEERIGWKPIYTFRQGIELTLKNIKRG